jgi:hypothetical protein
MELDDEQTEITSEHDWKEFNEPEFDRALETKTWQKIIDKVKNNERNMEMYENISRLIADPDSGVTVIITGSGHISFFRSKFPTAQFPLGIPEFAHFYT